MKVHKVCWLKEWMGKQMNEFFNAYSQTDILLRKREALCHGWKDLSCDSCKHLAQARLSVLFQGQGYFFVLTLA